MSFGDYQQNYSDLHSRILESLTFAKPVINSEYGYYLRDQNGDGVPEKDNSTSIESMRYASWDIVMAGGYLVTGFGTTYFGGNRDPGPFDVDVAKNDDWELQIGYIKKFFTGIEWWKLSSNDDILSSKTQRGSDGRQLGRIAPPSTTYWLLAEPGKRYVIYARGLTDQLILKTEFEVSEKFMAQLVNPRSGEIKIIPDAYEIKDNFKWSPPDNNDWVLHLFKQNL